MAKLRNFMALLITIGLLCSCSEVNVKTFEKKIIVLKSENDSLRSILKEIRTKYIFDSISIVNKPDLENTYKLGSDYKMNITISAYSKSDFFIKYDTIINNEMVNPDTLKFKNGNYEYINALDRDNKIIKIKMQTGDKRFGNYKQGTLYDKIRVKE